jgi:hypothetical protein
MVNGPKERKIIAWTNQFYSEHANGNSLKW